MFELGRISGPGWQLPDQFDGLEALLLCQAARHTPANQAGRGRSLRELKD